jgi:hypothetical protein
MKVNVTFNMDDVINILREKVLDQMDGYKIWTYTTILDNIEPADAVVEFTLIDKEEDK